MPLHAARRGGHRRHPKGQANLAIPTWFYGREPINLFATSIAKYFSNSLREEGLLAIGSLRRGLRRRQRRHAPGDLPHCGQNHYAEFGWCSPMVFLGTEDYRHRDQDLHLVQRTANENYRDLLYLGDDPQDVVDFIVAHPPRHPKVRG